MLTGQQKVKLEEGADPKIQVINPNKKKIEQVMGHFPRPNQCWVWNISTIFLWSKWHFISGVFNITPASLYYWDLVLISSGVSQVANDRGKTIIIRGNESRDIANALTIIERIADKQTRLST